MADKEEFTFRAGSVYELPLDKSLNMLQKKLCSEYPDLQHKHFSRKMIQCACLLYTSPSPRDRG